MLREKFNFTTVGWWLGVILGVIVTSCTPVVSDSVDLTDTPSTVPALSETSVVHVTATPQIFTSTPASVPTQIIETILPPPISTPLPTLTNTVESLDATLIHDDYLLFIEAYEQGYSKFDYALSQQLNPEQPFPLSVIDYAVSSDPDDPEVGPADARLLSFAHFADKMAYWTTDDGAARLWISDLETTNPELIYTDESQAYSDDHNDDAKFNLLWTPDDLHLIWSTHDDSPNYIYHLQSDMIEPWPWNCDRIALSPQTNHLATWCSPGKLEMQLAVEMQFAVIEWGGDIWYSETSPKIELIKQDERPQFSRPIWAWSSDGERLAYFDPNDLEGDLLIVDAQGNEDLSFSNGAWWIEEAVSESRIYLPSTLLQWSEDSSKLIVFAYPITSGACPQYQDYWTGSDESFDVPCLQLVDTETEKILWTWADLVNIAKDVDSNTWQVWDFTISPYGKRMAINIAVSGRVELGIVDIENGLYEQWAAYGGSVIRWGSNN